MKVNIIVDSTCDASPQIENKLITVPLTINIEGIEYIDGVTITNKEFYEKLIESDSMPVTSQATPQAFIDIFKSIEEKGEEAVVITVSSKLSGTYQSAMIAKEGFKNIHVVDSKSVAIGTGVLAELALKEAENGKSAKEIQAILEKERDNVTLIAMFDTLEYLKKGGRISKTAAIAGGLLSIKPVIRLNDGSVEIIGKARGSKQGNNLLIKEIEAIGGIDFTKPVMLGYTGLSDAILKKYIEDSAFLWKGNIDELRVALIGSVVGTHAGPGAVAAAFFNKR